MANTAATVTFDVPEPPKRGVEGGEGIQRFRIQVRRTANTASPLLNVYLDDAGAQKTQLITNQAITGDLPDGEVVEILWNASDLDNVDGSGVELRIEITEVSGVSGEVGAVSWDFTAVPEVTVHRVGVQRAYDIPDKTAVAFEEKAGADTLLLIGTEDPISYEIETTDALPLSMTETRALTKILPVRTDTLTLVINEFTDVDYGTPTDIFGTDDLTLIITESVDLYADLETTDGLTLIGTDTSDTPVDVTPDSDKEGTDDLTLIVTETSEVFAVGEEIASTDTLTLIVNESSYVNTFAAFVELESSDTLTLIVNESVFGPGEYGEVDSITVKLAPYGRITWDWI